MDFNLDPLSSKLLDEYAEKHSTPPSELLIQLERETHLRTHMPQMLSGPMQGAFLSMISRMIRPGKILEIGTFTGYSALCLAEGLQEGGILHTIEINPEMKDFAGRYFERSAYASQIQMHCGNALELIPGIPGPFDLVFIDADKDNYIAYFDLLLERISTAGWILADNTLWYGRVIDPSSKDDRETKGIMDFNDYIQAHPGVDNLMLPLRDGLTVIRKR